MTYSDRDELQFLKLDGSPAIYVMDELTLLVRLTAIECYQANGLEIIEVEDAIVWKGSDRDDNTEELR